MFMAVSSRIQPLKYVAQLISDSTLTKKAYLNAFASMLEYATSLLVGFAITPFMVSGLGDYSFGLWQVLNRLVGYLTPASGRPTFALKWTLANQQSSNDFEKKRRYIGSTLIVWAIFLPVMLSLGGIVAWLVPGWVKAPQAYVWTVRIVCLLLVANMIVDTLSNVPQSVLQGQNLAYKRMGMSAGLIVAGGLFTWLAIHFNLGLIGVAISVILETALTGFLFLAIIRGYAVWFGAAKPHWEELREILERSWWFLGWNLVTSLLLASDVVVLGLFNSITSVTSYTLTKYVPEMMISIIANVVFAVMPGLGGIVGAGDLQKAVRVRGEIMSLIWLVVTAMGTSVLLWNRSFLGLWVGGTRYSGSLPHLLIVLGVIQLVFIRSDASIIDLTLRLSQKVLLGLVSVAISVVAASLLVGYFKMGIIGLCLGIMLGRLLLTWGYPQLISRFLQIRGATQIRAMARPMIVSVVLLGCAFVVDIMSPSSSWPGADHWLSFFILAGLTGVAMLTLCFYTGLNREQRSNILRRARVLLAPVDHAH